MNPSLFCFLALSLFDPGAPVDGNSAEDPQVIIEAREAAAKGNFKKAFNLLEKSATDGSAPAAYGLGDLYLTGQGVEASLPKAVEWYNKAASAGNVNATLRLGEIYLQGGEGLERDEARARFFFRRAAEAGLAQGWGKLGVLSESAARAADEEPERKKQFREAREFYKEGATAGDPESQLRLGLILTNDQAGEVDWSESASWLKKAAFAGNVDAMNELGTRFKDGKGAEADPVVALGWFLVAAERNHPMGMTNLGLCYAGGTGVPVDFKKAGSWYDKAAKMNYAPAQFLIGQLFEQGQGTEAKPVFAYVQYARAAISGYALAIEARDALKPKLTPEQLKEAEALISKAPEEK